ncbi:MAG: ABC transporter substrate-binding protein [Opitutales bacterium]
MFRPDLPTEPRKYDAGEVDAVVAARSVEMPEELPQVQVPVDYAEGRMAAWYPKGEPPVLQEMVEQGQLPPVEERVGPEPLVMEGPDGLGQYGGTWTRVASSSGDVGVIEWRLSAASLFRWSPMGYPIVPHLAKGYEVSDDLREWTIFLRKGIKWSDGEAFDANDFLYWWEYEIGSLREGTVPNWMRIRGKDGKFEKVDDHTIRFVFEDPYATFLEALASPDANPYAPEHYLSQYHPEIGDPELIEAAMETMGVDIPRSVYFSLKSYDNVDIPRMWPWIYRNHRSAPPQTFVRNPYYFAVDTEGNQLPYVDRILFQEKTLQLIPLAAAGGDISMQTRHIKFTDYTMLMEQRENSNYELYHWFPASRSVWSLFPNINRRINPEDPKTKFKAEFLRKKEFRQALSLAINRERIISAEYNNVGEPSQIEPGVYSPFHSEKLKNAFIEYAPERASAMLDELGLDQYDSEGMRVFPDGTRMTFYIDFTDFTGEGPVQFIVDDWAKIGVRAIQRERARPLFANEKFSYQHDFTVWTGESEFHPLVQPRSFVPTYLDSHFAPGYGEWYRAGGLYGLVEEANEKLIEPPLGSPAREAMVLLDQANAESDPEKQAEIVRKILEINAEQVWSISVSTPPPQIVVVKNDFKNVPQVATFGAAYNTPGNTGMETYYFTDPADSPGALAAIQRSILEPTRAKNSVARSNVVSEEGFDVGGFILNVLLVILGLGLLLIAVKHPFIGRRFIVLIPTLTIISIAGFVMIQLPPGSFVETKILELRMSGDEAAIEQVEELVERFHLDEPVWKQYVRWVGFKWFFTFDSGDKGLLQGYMGRSMETGQSVNDVVGDRVLLTFFVSLGTLLFTWVTAVPIGIYSAVRQYSIGDYIFTFLGFIGMCVPNFLLAILLMYWSNKYLGMNVTGLFSVEYAAAPEWTWGKVVDLLKHIWVPVIIIGTAGTAGMIRVMRGNLLDELKKPYVTTARAKGVRPMKMLMKYPVRLALNPFISGIGGIFPMLVSGGAIVAIVLSLPMVGPVMLQGLMTQDLYLAASMLMMFSLLGVMGTLVSDLLLLWVDPRIRMEGGKR